MPYIFSISPAGSGVAWQYSTSQIYIGSNGCNIGTRRRRRILYWWHSTLGVAGGWQIDYRPAQHRPPLGHLCDIVGQEETAAVEVGIWIPQSHLVLVSTQLTIGSPLAIAITANLQGCNLQLEGDVDDAYDETPGRIQ